jgi:hypothetical protein
MVRLDVLGTHLFSKVQLSVLKVLAIHGLFLDIFSGR